MPGRRRRRRRRRPTIAGRPRLVRQAARDEPDDADRPGTHGEDRCAARTAGGADARVCRRLLQPALLPGRLPGIGHPERRSRLGDGRAHEVATGAVGRLEHGGQRGRLVERRGEQQPGGVQRLPHPPGGVEPGREDEADRLEVHGGRARRRREPGGRRCRAAARSACAPGRAARSSGSRPASAPRPTTVPMVARSASSRASASPPASSPRSRRATVNATPDPDEPAIGIRGASARCGLTTATAAGRTSGRWWWSVTMTSIPRAAAAATSATLVDPVSTVTISATPSRGRGLDRRQRQAVPFLEPAGHVWDGVEAEPPEGQHELREPGQAVGIEVAEHHHPFRALDGAPDARDQELGVGQEPRVVEAVGGGAEEAGHGGRIGDAASCEDRGRERPEAELAGRGADAPERGGAAPGTPSGGAPRSSPRGCHVRLTPGLPGGRRVAGARRAERPSSRIGSRRRPGPTITWRVGGLGEPRARPRAAGRPARARRRAAGRR